MDEVRVERLDLGIVSIDRIEGESHGNDANGLQNFSNLRATRTVTPGRIAVVTRKELSAVVAECAARSERAHALIEESVARGEAIRMDMEASRAENEKAISAASALAEEARARQEEARAEYERLRPRWEKERAEFREHFEESRRKTDKILVELREGRDERRALLEALFRVMDRLPPPPPNLRSA